MLMKVGSAIKALYGEYFYDFSEQNTNGFTGAGVGEDVISDYLVGAGVTPSSNYFFTENLSPSSSTTVTKIEVSFYTPVVITPNVSTNYVRQILFESKAATGQYIILGNSAGVLSTEIISLGTGGNVWYITSSEVPSISIGFHTLIIEWNSGANRYDFTFDGSTYAGTVYVVGVLTNPFVINNSAFNIMRRADSSSTIPHPNGAYTSTLKFYDSSNNLVLNFLNKYGANGTTYEWDGYTFTRVVGDATKRVTTSVPSQYRIENSSPNKPSFVLGNALQFDGVNDYVSFTAINNGNTDHSHSFWIKLITTPAGFNVAFLRSSSSASEYIGINGSTVIRYRINTIADFTVPSMVINVWYHIGITYKSGIGTRLYFNGVESTTGLIAGVQTYKFDEIGRYAGGAINGGKIMNEVATWNTTLSATDVANLYNSGNGDFATNYSPANLQAYWRCNEEDGATTLIDETGNYNGTLHNFNFDGTDGFVRHGYYKELAPFTGVAADFDGTTVINPPSGVDLVGDFTIHFANSVDTYVSWMGICTANANADSIRYRFGSLNLRIRIDSNNYDWAFIPSISADTVIQRRIITITRNGSNLTAYLDGVSLGTLTGVSTNNFTIDNIGWWDTSGNYKFKGSMETFIGISEAINDTQAAQLATRPELTKNYLVDTVGVTWSNVALFYPLTEGGGDIAYDLSDNKNHGTITNPAWVTGLSKGRQLGLQNVSQYKEYSDPTHDLNMSIPDLTTYSNAKVEIGIVTKETQGVLMDDGDALSYFLGCAQANGNPHYAGVGTPVTTVDNVIIGITRTDLFNAISDGQYHKLVYDGVDFTAGWARDEFRFFNYGGAFTFQNTIITHVKIDLNNNGTWDHVFEGKDLEDTVGAATTTINGTPETITLPEVGFGDDYTFFTSGAFRAPEIPYMTIGSNSVVYYAEFITTQSQSFAGLISQSLYGPGNGRTGLWIDSNGINGQYTAGGIAYNTLYNVSYATGQLIKVMQVIEYGVANRLYVNGVLVDEVDLTGVTNSTTITSYLYLNNYHGAPSTGQNIYYGTVFAGNQNIPSNEEAIQITTVGEYLTQQQLDTYATDVLLQPDNVGYNKARNEVFTSISAIYSTKTYPSDRTEGAKSRDTFGLECNSNNMIVTGNTFEQMFALRANDGTVRYDGHAGSFVNIKQIQLWLNPKDATDIEYVLTDEENNRILYIEGNQVKSDFGLSGVMVADVETDVIVNNVNNLISIEFTVPVDFEEVVIGSDFVGTPGTFGEFTFDKLNIFKDAVGWQDVVWTDLSSGITAIRSNLSATSLGSSYGNGASSDIALEGDFTIEFNCVWLDYSYVGLDTRPNTILAYEASPKDGFDFGISIRTSQFVIGESGINVVIYTPEPNDYDVIKFIRVGSTVSVYVNNILRHTYSHTDSSPLYLKANRYSGTLNNYISNVRYYLQ